MKYAIVTNPNREGTETDFTWWLLDPKEGGILHDAQAPLQLGKPTRIRSLPCAEYHEWSE